MSRKHFARDVYVGILFKQNFVCACGCGETIARGEKIDYDHAVALSLGGEDEPGNLVALKRDHHKPKTARDAARRAKLARIAARDGMRLPRPNKHARRLAAIERWRNMP